MVIAMALVEVSDNHDCLGSCCCYSKAAWDHSGAIVHGEVV